MTTSFDTKKPNPSNPQVRDVHPKEVWEKKAQAYVIDVRRPDEFTGELGHIPGARLIVLDTLPNHMNEIPKDQTVVFCCRSGGRSGQACAFALSQGWTDVYNMSGGMLLWNELGLTVEGRDEG